MSQTVNTHLLVYTKIYATEQLERFLRHSIERYFKFLEALAEQDARNEPGAGDYKKLVMFQRRVNQIQHYDADRQVDVCEAMVRDKSAPIDSLLKTILLANAMIIGSFGQTGIETHKIKIPSRQVFILRVLCIAAKEYFTDPSILESSRAQRAIVTDSISAAIQDLFPFEELVGPIVNGQQNFHASTSDKQFAQRMVDQSTGYSMTDVERAAAEMGQTKEDTTQADMLQRSMSDPMFAGMPNTMRPGAPGGPTRADLPSTPGELLGGAPTPSSVSFTRNAGEHQSMYDEYIAGGDAEAEGKYDSASDASEYEDEEQPHMSRLREEYADDSDEDETPHAGGLRSARQQQQQPAPPRSAMKKPTRRSDTMGFVDSD